MMTTHLELEGPEPSEEGQEAFQQATTMLTMAIHAISDTYAVCPVCLLNNLHGMVAVMEADADKEGKTLHKGGEDGTMH